MIRTILTITLLLTTLMVSAQTFLNDLRKTEVGQGTVTVVQTTEIDSLVNGTKKTQTPTVTTTPKQEETTTETETTKPAQKVTVLTPETDPENTVLDTRKKVMRNAQKMQGYRIQVFSGGNSRLDRQKAETAGAVMKSNFPNEPIYVHFYSPSWKCRMGNYRTVDEARAVLARVKKAGYPQACIVKGTITVQRRAGDDY